mgnify:CR=1 FL=1
MTVQDWECVLALIERGVCTTTDIATELGRDDIMGDSKKNQARLICRNLEKWGKIERAGTEGRAIIWRIASKPTGAKEAKA